MLLAGRRRLHQHHLAVRFLEEAVAAKYAKSDAISSSAGGSTGVSGVSFRKYSESDRSMVRSSGAAAAGREEDPRLAATTSGGGMVARPDGPAGVGFRATAGGAAGGGAGASAWPARGTAAGGAAGIGREGGGAGEGSGCGAGCGAGATAGRGATGGLGATGGMGATAGMGCTGGADWRAADVRTALSVAGRSCLAACEGPAADAGNGASSLKPTFFGASVGAAALETAAALEADADDELGSFSSRGAGRRRAAPAATPEVTPTATAVTPPEARVPAEEMRSPVA
mmetsp:Transcript_1873/g.4421  ORF Transcript_1873/g.4421 Transcript_1873/m.4421 type:complete len:285 (+) Transcript_1873:98-952(+)